MTTPLDWSSDPLPARTDPWDLVVLGGGTAGIVAAKTAAGLGADVLLVERHRTGGDCLWTGCVPSKSLLSQAHRPDAGSRDLSAAMAQVHAAIATIEPIDSPADLRRNGVTVVHGDGQFTGPNRLSVGGDDVRFRHAVLATGSAPVVPPIPGIDGVEALTSDSVWSLTELPETLLVVGGGSIGCELGQAFARFGSTVTLVEGGARILPREDADAAEVLHATLTADGVDVRTGVSVASFEGTTAVLDDGSRISAPVVLVSVGRRPTTDRLGLEAAGIDIGERGHVVVDARLRTTNHRVWAAGDVTPHPAFTHVAGMHGSLAASNAFLGVRRSVDLATVPRVTYTQPEVAAFGVSAEQAAAGGLTVRTAHHDDVDRAVVDGRTEGFSRLVLDSKGRIVGASVVGPRAGESLAEVVLAARHGVRARDLAGAMHAYPTYADGLAKAALGQVQDDLASPWVRRVIRLLGALRRRLHRA